MAKPSYTVTWTDLQRCVAEYESDLRVVVVFAVHPTRGGRAEPYAECIIKARDGWDAGREICRVRDGLPRGDATAPWAALLYMLHSAVQAMESDPWSWPAERRSTARGDK